MNEIERIIDKFTLGKTYLYKKDRINLAKIIEQHVKEYYISYEEYEKLYKKYDDMSNEYFPRDFTM